MLGRKLGLCFFIGISLVLNCLSAAWAAEPMVEGKAGVVIDSKSGQVLYGKNENLPLPPASTTKILTALLAVENSKPTDIVKIGPNPALCEPSSIGLKDGESITMENLLYALLIKSANDTAVAIAEHISGSVPEFAKLMNKRAKELGAANTHFVNPNGLPDPQHQHYSTARDLGLMARYAMEAPLIRKIVSTRYKTIPREDDTAVKWLPNHNKMLWQYEGANGVKTGYTTEAKQCLISSAARGNQELIAVVLGSQGSNVWTDSTNLLDYGFANFDTVKYSDANKLMRTVAVEKGNGTVNVVTEKDLYYTVSKGQSPDIEERVELYSTPTAPVKKGQVLGKLKLFTSEQELGYVNLVAASDVSVRKVFGTDYKTSPLNPITIGIVLLVLFVFWNLKKHRARVPKRKRGWHNRNGIR